MRMLIPGSSSNIKGIDHITISATTEKINLKDKFLLKILIAFVLLKAISVINSASNPKSAKAMNKTDKV